MGRWLSKMTAGLIALGALLLPGLAARAGAQTEPEPEDVVRFYHVDPLGSTRAITDAEGAVVSRKDYFPFGEELGCTFGRVDEYCNAFDPGLRFAGKPHDDESELDYFGARYLSASQGRFASVDPEFAFADHINDPQQWNRYTYAVNNPYTYTDPDGRIVKAIVLIGKVGHALYKGYDVYTTVQGVAESGGTVFSMDVRVGTGDRLWATASLVSELSGATDLFKGGKKLASAAAAVVDKVGDAKDAVKTGQNVTQAATPAAHALSDRDFLQKIATKAETTGQRLGKGAAGDGPAQGTWKHKYAEKVLERYQNMTGKKTDLVSERSFLGGVQVPHGTAGSARPDVFNPKTGQLFDYKFVRNPGTGLSQRQRRKNALNVPGLTSQDEINP